jgi:hypothetical protein
VAYFLRHYGDAVYEEAKPVATVEVHQGIDMPGDHVVQFYERDSELVLAVTGYINEAFASGEVAIVIATEAHRLAFDRELAGLGVDLERVRGDGRYVALDAATTLAEFTTEGSIDDARFQQVIGGILRQAVATGRPVRAYGEMVALLWEARLRFPVRALLRIPDGTDFRLRTRGGISPDLSSSLRGDLRASRG